MIAVDTNILVHAHRRDSRWHLPALMTVRKLAEGTDAWAIPAPCLHEFFAVATHPRLYSPPSTTTQALRQIAAWRQSPQLTILSEDDEYWSMLEDILQRGDVVGPMVHDARVAALCLRHGVRELYTADRDFSRFPTLAAHNPLI